MFADTVTMNGGKVSKSICKKTTHMVWKDGKLRSLLAAHDSNIKIVTPLWIKDSLADEKVKNECNYQPNNLEAKLREARHKEAQTL